MKSKTKFDPKVIQQFAVDHTEKFVIGLVAALFLFFAYKSFVLVGNGYGKNPTHERRPRTSPQTISITLARQRRPMKRRCSRLTGRLSMSTGRPLIRARIRCRPACSGNRLCRAGPAPCRTFSRSSSCGPFRGGARFQIGRQCRYERQALDRPHGTRPLQEAIGRSIRAKFDGAAWNDPREDVPKYVGFFVQRAEVVPGATGEPKWEFMMFPPVDPREAEKLGEQTAAEIAEPRYVRPDLTSPLPRLVDATWGNEAVCPPKIPIVEARRAMEMDLWSPDRWLANPPTEAVPGPDWVAAGPCAFRPRARYPRGLGRYHRRERRKTRDRGSRPPGGRSRGAAVPAAPLLSTSTLNQTSSTNIGSSWPWKIQTKSWLPTCWKTPSWRCFP